LYLLGIRRLRCFAAWRIIADEERGIARRRPETLPDLVALVHKCRIQEFADVAGMVDMEIPSTTNLMSEGFTLILG